MGQRQAVPGTFGSCFLREGRRSGPGSRQVPRCNSSVDRWRLLHWMPSHTFGSDQRFIINREFWHGSSAPGLDEKRGQMKNDNEVEGDEELPQSCIFLVEGRTSFGAGTRSGRCRQRRHGIGALAGQEMPRDHQRILNIYPQDSIPGTRSPQRRCSQRFGRCIQRSSAGSRTGSA